MSRVESQFQSTKEARAETKDCVALYNETKLFETEITKVQNEAKEEKERMIRERDRIIETS